MNRKKILEENARRKANPADFRERTSVVSATKAATRAANAELARKRREEADAQEARAMMSLGNEREEYQPSPRG